MHVAIRERHLFKQGRMHSSGERSAAPHVCARACGGVSAAARPCMAWCWFLKLRSCEKQPAAILNEQLQVSTGCQPNQQATPTYSPGCHPVQHVWGLGWFNKQLPIFTQQLPSQQPVQRAASPIIPRQPASWISYNLSPNHHPVAIMMAAAVCSSSSQLPNTGSKAAQRQHQGLWFMFLLVHTRIDCSRGLATYV